MSPLVRDFIRGASLAVVLVSIVVVLVSLQGCETWQRQPELTAGVKTITVTKAVPVPCVDATDIPPEFASAMPDKGADTARKAAGASLDVRALVQRDRTMRALLIQCSTLKEEPK